ncbi:hypothetical protein F5888DRAFT_1694544, partial [Russula emetica]
MSLDFPTFPFLSLSPLFLATTPSLSQHLARLHDPTDQQHRQEHQRPDLDPDYQALTHNSSVSRNGGPPCQASLNFV